MFCSRCGTSLVEGTTFCTNCGAPQGIAAPVAAYPLGGAIAPPMGGVPMNYVPMVPYAGFWLRAVAYLLDALIVGIVALPVIIGLAVVTGLSAAVGAMGSNSQNDPAAVLATAGFFMFLSLLIVIMLGGLWLYYAL